jgi:phosphoribosylanthranilate isomerase
MTWIKICGTTNLEDALIAIEAGAGADALGFVFYEKSPRYVDAARIEQIIAKLPAEVEKIGVFVGWTKADLQIAQQLPLTGVQIHGGFNQTTADLPCDRKVYLALRAAEFFDSEGRFDSFALRAEDRTRKTLQGILLDSGTAQTPGGTGKVFDWEKAVPMAETIRRSGIPLVVAGGLHPGNVAEAMRILNPWGVDVVSGVEASPGRKDPAKIKAFIQAVRQADGART